MLPCPFNTQKLIGFFNFISAFTQSRGPMLTVDQLKGYISTIKTLTSRRLRVREIQWRPSSKFSC